MLQRLIFTFSLIVSFGMAQIGAINHEFSHYQITSAAQENSDSEARSSSDPYNSLPHTQGCEKCVGFAGINPLLYENAVSVFDDSASYHFGYATQQGFKLHFNAVYAARAPPTFA